MKPFKIRTTRLTVIPEGEPLFSEMVTHIEIDDEGGGEFLRIIQQSSSGNADGQQITITAEEWPMITVAVEKLRGAIAEWENQAGKEGG